MNKLRFYILTLAFIGCFSSCSTDTDDTYSFDKEIIGVWEQNGFLEAGGKRLLFEPNKTYFKISRTVDDEDHLVSGIVEYHWEVHGNVITVLEDEAIVESFTVNPEGQLVSSNSEDMPYDKISNTTSGYY